MIVAPGTRLGSYELIAVLGAGGMGEVYRARDLNLGRQVAVKILQPRFVDDREHVERFRREAYALASLTPPYIAAIYELEEASGVLFLAMELVEGETLDDRLASGALSLPEALRIALQIASGLEAAHDKGIIHRDLKPANIKITPEGTVKVLDFGLAKILGESASVSMLTRSPTETTGQGTILGTVGYMSPEQARGKPVDRRTDIWSFGCVLFKIITRERPFQGDTVSDTIVSILEREPDWRMVPDSTPASVRRLLERCLHKDLHRRLRDIGDARFELEEALSSSPSRVDVRVPDAVSAIRRRAPWRTAGVIGSIVFAAASGYFVGAVSHATPPPRLMRQFTAPLPPSQRLAGVDFPAVAISPDGSQIVYVGTRGGRTQLFVRPMNSLDAVPIAGTVDAISPFFSSDGRWVAFFADGKLKKVPAFGGAPIAICDAAIGFGGTWGPRNRIVFSPTTGSGLMEVSADGGKPSRATTLDAASGEFSHRWPELLPDGDTVVFTVGTVGSWDDAQIVAQSLSSGRRALLVHGGTNPHYLKSGYLVYSHGGALLAVPLDVRSLRTSGQPSRVLDNVMQSSDGAAQVAIAESGDAVYVPALITSAERRLLNVDRSGAGTPLAAPARAYGTPRLSPDGRRLAVTITGASDDLWAYDIASGTLQQLTFDADAASPIWTPDGSRITFSWNKDGPPNLFWVRVDEGSREERLASSEYLQMAGSWSPDGRTLAYVESRPTTGRDIWLLERDREQKSVRFIATTFDETAPQIGPDGRTVAFVSNESGGNEVYVSRVDDPTHAMVQISGEGGSEPVWSRSTHELMYRAGNRLMAVPQPANNDWSSVRPRLLFERNFQKGTPDVANYDVATDGQHFIMVEAAERDTAPQELRIVLNWAHSLTTTPR
jgi:serine/threonine-protein kinase